MAEPASYWFNDYLTPDLTLQHSVKNVLYSARSRYQRIEIIETGSYGVMLVLDGKPQSAEKDEHIYHEALVHPALLAHPRPETVFVAGGGEGATLREIYKHKGIKQVVMVDLDPQVVMVCKQHLKKWHQGAFEDKRTKLIFDDAKAYLERTPKRYDVIISDIPDPLEGGPAYMLFTRNFYRMLADRLTPDGVLVVQAGFTTPGMSQVYSAIHNTLEAVFPIVAPFQALVPSFSSTWGFIVASKKHDPRKLTASTIDGLIKGRLASPLRSYDGVTHTGMFNLPKELREGLAKETMIITEKKPVFAY